MTALRSTTPDVRSYATDLLCLSCGVAYAPERTRLLCDCGSPLEQQYDTESLARERLGADRLNCGLPGIWRFAALLPVQDLNRIVTLHEGGTPLVRLERIGPARDLRIFVKDEGRNPTGTFKARGAAAGVSRLRELGWTSLAMPTVGSGGSAWSAYGARACVRVEVGLPVLPGLPRIGIVEPPLYGAPATQFTGTTESAFSAFRDTLGPDTAYVGGLHEPYRLEGEKTILFEIVEQLGGELPDYVVWPTGGAVGLVGLAKAYDELVRIGVVSPGRPLTVVSAQHESSAPIALALRGGLPDPVTGTPGGVAPGVWVGKPFAGRYVLDRMRGTVCVDGGTAGDRQLLATMRETAREEGLLLSPEGALTVAVLANMRDAGRIRANATVVCVNTATALRYPDLLERVDA